METLTETEQRDAATEPIRPLEVTLNRIRELIESGQLKTASDSNTCSICFGTGMEVVAGKGARKCRCRIAALIAERLMKIPPRYARADLATLEPRPELHPKQELVIDLMKAEPFSSYVFCGRPESGKTHFFWSLYRHAAHDPNRRIVACSMLQLINDYREAFKPVPEGADPYEIKTVKPNDLMQSSIPWSIFLDDIDKPRMTEYVAEQIHTLFDAAYINNHQIVVTTNLTEQKLKEHFDRGDERYGQAIVRRIIHGESNVIELF